MKDNKIKKIVEEGLYQKAPIGMMDRIMANLAVNPVRRLSIKPVEPKPIFAILLSISMASILIVGLLVKPETMLPHNWNISIDIAINPAWVTPMLVTTLAVWAYIIINNKLSKT